MYQVKGNIDGVELTCDPLEAGRMQRHFENGGNYVIPYYMDGRYIGINWSNVTIFMYELVEVGDEEAE